MSTDRIGGAMSFGEALLHVGTLANDPTSHVHAALAEWEHPASREFLVLADIFDAAAHHTYKKPKPYPRPWPDAEGSTSERWGEPIQPEQLPDVLAAFGRALPVAPPPGWPAYLPAAEPKPEPRLVANSHD